MFPLGNLTLLKAEFSLKINPFNKCTPSKWSPFPFYQKIYLTSLKTKNIHAWIHEFIATQPQNIQFITHKTAKLDLKLQQIEYIEARTENSNPAT